MNGQWFDHNSNDFFIITQIEKYIKMNLDQGRTVMITFLRRDLDFGNRQADVLGKFADIMQFAMRLTFSKIHV